MAEIEGGCPLLDAWHVEAMADQADALRTADTPEGVAEGLGCRVVVVPMTAGLFGLRVPQIVFARAGTPLEVRRVAIYHELSHEVIRRHRIAHTHPDVWGLTLALGAPMRLLREIRAAGRLTAAEIVRRTGLPVWAADARLRMGAVTERLRVA